LLLLKNTAGTWAAEFLLAVQLEDVEVDRLLFSPALSADIEYFYNNSILW
jgi:hypothetical protein